MIFYGRAYRKMVSQIWAYVAFRWIAVWLLVAACSARGNAGEAAACVIIAGDLSLGFALKAIVVAFQEKSAKDWHDRLTNRLFYKLFLEEIVSGRGKNVDVDETFRLATIEARSDIAKADADERSQWGFLDRTMWHWFGGILSFVWQWLAAFLYYGSAWAIGHH